MAGLSLLALQPSERKRVDSNYESSVLGINEAQASLLLWLGITCITSDRRQCRNCASNPIAETLLLWLVHFTSYFDYYGLVRVSELSSFVIVRIDAFCGSIWHALQVHSSLLRSSHQGPRASAILSLTAFQFYRGTFFR